MASSSSAEKEAGRFPIDIECRWSRQKDSRTDPWTENEDTTLMRIANQRGNVSWFPTGINCTFSIVLRQVLNLIPRVGGSVSAVLNRSAVECVKRYAILCKTGKISPKSGNLSSSDESQSEQKQQYQPPPVSPPRIASRSPFADTTQVFHRMALDTVNDIEADPQLDAIESESETSDDEISYGDAAFLPNSPPPPKMNPFEGDSVSQSAFEEAFLDLAGSKLDAARYVCVLFALEEENHIYNVVFYYIVL